MKLKLFYSYCHSDEQYRECMEIALSTLRRNNLIREWSDRKIIAGQKISDQIKKEIRNANIIVFMISQYFLDSDACIDEWNFSKNISDESGSILIPIILHECSWKDFDNAADYLALPKDAVPITKWDDINTAWQNVYDGIKDVIFHLHKNFQIKNKFKESISTIEFCSQSKEDVYLDDLFVFPMLYLRKDSSTKEHIIRNINELLENKNLLIKGDEQSGKTKLSCHVFFEINKNGNPVLFIDLNDIKHKNANIEIFREIYTEEFQGDFDLWIKQTNKTIIFDNLFNDGNSLDFVLLAKKYFDRIIITATNDKYDAYFKDELRISEFKVVSISPLSHEKQEQLIRKWTSLKSGNDKKELMYEDGNIDQIERNINEIIINNKILPRYPFFILSILQTYEGFMPQDVQITAYGHCYYALILAHLIKAGVDKKDVSIDSCFNFLSHLAFNIYKSEPILLKITKNQFDKFLEKYKRNYIIENSIVNRLYDNHGVLKLSDDGNIYFNLPYSYYFFLGRYLAKTYEKNKEFVTKMIEKSYVRNNTLSLIFAIHHSQDIEIIDEILIHTMCAIDNIPPSKLDEKETKIFQDLLSSIPERILSDLTVDEERAKERNMRDQLESVDTDIEETDHNLVNQVYKSHKNIEILSQILKNKYGSLEKKKVEEIIEIISDTGLRLVNLILSDEKQIHELTIYIEKKYEESDEFDKSKKKETIRNDIRKMVTGLVFLWTMSNIEKIVSSISKPEIKDIVKSVVEKKNTPAFDIIQYFYTLDTANKFDETHKQHLEKIMSKYERKRMSFLYRVLSLRTQHYLNTHHVKAPLKQATSSLLGIEYRP